MNVEEGDVVLTPLPDIVGVIGAVSAERHARLLRRLSLYLVENIANKRRYCINQSHVLKDTAIGRRRREPAASRG